MIGTFLAEAPAKITASDAMICYGCGSELQSNNNLQAGYIAKLQDNSHF